MSRDNIRLRVYNQVLFPAVNPKTGRIDLRIGADDCPTRARLTIQLVTKENGFLAQVPKWSKGEVCKTSRPKGSRKSESYLVLNTYI